MSALAVAMSSGSLRSSAIERCPIQKRGFGGDLPGFAFTMNHDDICAKVGQRHSGEGAGAKPSIRRYDPEACPRSSCQTAADDQGLAET